MKENVFRSITNLWNKKTKDDSGRCRLRVLVEIFSEELRVIGKVRTAQAYWSVFHSITKYTGEEDVFIENITPPFLMKYQYYMQKNGNALNTISFYMRNLRAIYNKGLKRGFYPLSNPSLFSDVFTGFDKTVKRSIDVREISSLEKKIIEIREDIESKKKKKAKKTRTLVSLYYFLFCFYARGMSFVDMALLKKKDIVKDTLCYYRHKTGRPIEIKLTSEMKNILHFFTPMVKESEYLFPIIKSPENKVRRQYESALRLQNKYLKEIAGLCNIPQTLSTHVARHSWATLAKRQHVPLEVISESLGHASVKTTSIYLNSFGQSVLDQANRRVARAVKKAI